jgi:hypothetical protein
MDGVDAAGVEQNALRERCLARVDVRADADIADVAQVVAVRRRLPLLLQWQRRKVPAAAVVVCMLRVPSCMARRVLNTSWLVSGLGDDGSEAAWQSCPGASDAVECQYRAGRS